MISYSPVNLRDLWPPNDLGMGIVYPHTKFEINIFTGNRDMAHTILNFTKSVILGPNEPVGILPQCFKRQLGCWGCCTVKTVWKYVKKFWPSAPLWQTDWWKNCCGIWCNVLCHAIVCMIKICTFVLSFSSGSAAKLAVEKESTDMSLASSADL